MAIGVVTSKEFNSELNSASKQKLNTPVSTPVSNPVLEGEVVDSPTRGRGEGNVAVPESLQKTIAHTALVDGRRAALDLAKMYGVSDSSVSAYSNGASSTSSYNTPKDGITKVIKSTKERIAKTARGKLKLALSQITTDKFADAKLRDITGAARDMAAVVLAMEPQKSAEVNIDNGPKFILYSPSVVSESNFERVHVSE